MQHEPRVVIGCKPRQRNPLEARFGKALLQDVCGCAMTRWERAASLGAEHTRDRGLALSLHPLCVPEHLPSGMRVASLLLRILSCHCTHRDHYCKQLRHTRSLLPSVIETSPRIHDERGRLPDPVRPLCCCGPRSGFHVLRGAVDIRTAAAPHTASRYRPRRSQCSVQTCMRCRRGRIERIRRQGRHPAASTRPDWVTKQRPSLGRTVVSSRYGGHQGQQSRSHLTSRRTGNTAGQLGSERMLRHWALEQEEPVSAARREDRKVAASRRAGHGNSLVHHDQWAYEESDRSLLRAA